METKVDVKPEVINIADSCLNGPVLKEVATYPEWIKSFNKECSKIYGTRCSEKLEKLMDEYIKHIKKELLLCERSPNRSALIANRMYRTMLFFYFYYLDVKEFFMTSLWQERMTELLSMYCQLEMKAAHRMQRGKETDGMVCARIMSAMWIYLAGNEDLIIHAILRIPTFSKKSKDMFEPIFKKLLIANKPNRALTDLEYIRNLLTFKLWKRLYFRQDKKTISNLALTELKPPQSFINSSRKYRFLPCYAGKTDVNGFLVTALFDLEATIKEYFAYIDKKNIRNLESNFRQTEKISFLSELSASFSTNSDNIQDLSTNINDNYVLDEIKLEIELKSDEDDDLIIIDPDEPVTVPAVIQPVPVHSVPPLTPLTIIDLTEDEPDTPSLHKDNEVPMWCQELIKRSQQLALDATEAAPTEPPQPALLDSAPTSLNDLVANEPKEDVKHDQDSSQWSQENTTKVPARVDDDVVQSPICTNIARPWCQDEVRSTNEVDMDGAPQASPPQMDDMPKGSCDEMEMEVVSRAPSRSDVCMTPLDIVDDSDMYEDSTGITEITSTSQSVEKCGTEITNDIATDHLIVEEHVDSTCNLNEECEIDIEEPAVIPYIIECEAETSPLAISAVSNSVFEEFVSGRTDATATFPEQALDAAKDKESEDSSVYCDQEEVSSPLMELIPTNDFANYLSNFRPEGYKRGAICKRSDDNHSTTLSDEVRNFQDEFKRQRPSDDYKRLHASVKSREDSFKTTDTNYQDVEYQNKRERDYLGQTRDYLGQERSEREYKNVNSDETSFQSADYQVLEREREYLGQKLDYLSKESECKDRAVSSNTATTSFRSTDSNYESDDRQRPYFGQQQRQYKEYKNLKSVEAIPKNRETSFPSSETEFKPSAARVYQGPPEAVRNYLGGPEREYRHRETAIRSGQSEFRGGESSFKTLKNVERNYLGQKHDYLGREAEYKNARDDFDTRASPESVSGDLTVNRKRKNGEHIARYNSSKPRQTILKSPSSSFGQASFAQTSFAQLPTQSSERRVPLNGEKVVRFNIWDTAIAKAFKLSSREVKLTQPYISTRQRATPPEPFIPEILKTTASPSGLEVFTNYSAAKSKTILERQDYVKNENAFRAVVQTRPTDQMEIATSSTTKHQLPDVVIQTKRRGARTKNEAEMKKRKRGNRKSTRM